RTFHICCLTAVVVHLSPTRRSSDLKDTETLVKVLAGVKIGAGVTFAPGSRADTLSDVLRARHASPGRPAVSADASRSAPSRATRSEETRLNSSHVSISYAVFCLKKK